MAGIEKYYISIMLIVCFLYGYSLFVNDAIGASGNSSTLSFAGFNHTMKYYSQLNQTTQEFKTKLETTSTTNNGFLGDLANLLVLAGQSVALAVTSLFTSLQIGVALVGDISGLGFIPTFFLAIGLLAMILFFLLAALRAIRLGDTQ